VLAVTFFATLLLDLEFAIFVGVLVSLVLFLNRTSHPIMRSLVPDPRHTGRKMTRSKTASSSARQLKILRIEGSIYFARWASQRHLDTLREHSSGQKHLLLMSKSINSWTWRAPSCWWRKHAGGGRAAGSSISTA